MIHLEAQIKQFVLDQLVFDEALDDLDVEASLVANGLIDSLGVLEIIAFIEMSYGIEVAEEDVIPEYFDSVRNLANYVSLKLPRSEASPVVAYLPTSVPVA